MQTRSLEQRTFHREFLIRTSSLFHKDKVIRKCMVHYLKKNVPSSSELRKCLSLAFEKYYTAVRMSRPRPQLSRNKSSRVRDSNRHFYLITRRTAKHKKDLSVLWCIQDQSVTKYSTEIEPTK